MRAPITGTGTILVVDDELMIRRLLNTVISRAGYKVEESESGEEAVAKYLKAKEGGNSFAAVIMDLTMPGSMGGQEATQKILEIDPNAKIIVSSGYSNDPIMSNYRAFGFSGVVTKPYNVDQLKSELARVISLVPQPVSVDDKPKRESAIPGYKKVLIMEDSDLIRKSISECLADLGFEVEFAKEGNETLAKYQAARDAGRPFGVLLIDITVKEGMDGKETIVKLLEIDPEVKAIATSGYSHDDIMRSPEKFGFRSSLPKPYSLDQLSEALTKLLDAWTNIY